MIVYCFVLIILPFTFARSIVNEGLCEEGKTSFFVIDNASLNLADSILYKDTSEQNCLKTCTQNRDQFKRPIVCNAFTYDHASFSCTIHQEKAVPVGSAQMQMSIGKRYFEKICLSHELPEPCNQAQFIRVDQSVLESDCKSAMYFYEDGECITNKESALTKPSGFTKEESDRVIYFQNGCDASGARKVITSESTDVWENASSSSSRQTESRNAPVGEKATEGLEPRPRVITLISETTPKPESEVADVVENVSENYEQIGEEEYEEGTEELSEETDEYVAETTAIPTTTIIRETTASPQTSFETFTKPVKTLIQKKIKKNPRNFGSKTYEILKQQETGKQLKTENLMTDNEAIEETYFSEWSDWTPCTKSQERQVRRRRCLNLRKCLGALMQVQNCPVILQTSTPENRESVRSMVSIDGEDYDEPIAVDNIPVESVPSRLLPVLNEQVWGLWQGSCQQFASSQPCNNGNMIGFESRECIAKNPSQCEGPFFRYCTINC
ncbi:unnamed protein product [Caenorhabditis sp. 36 PRJEB53466]|nr:unnamed protein product [Caenorhabditis sp. 36 PRJEB53466]